VGARSSQQLDSASAKSIEKKRKAKGASDANGEMADANEIGATTNDGPVPPIESAGPKRKKNRRGLEDTKASSREASLEEGEDVQISTNRAKTAKKATRIQPISEVVPFGDDPVEFVQDNPRKIGTLTHDRYEKYKSAKTPNEALRLGALKGEIPYDFQRGFMKRRNT